MNKGICIFAQNNNKSDYVKQAYFLAKSIKKFNQTESVSIITNDEIPEEYQAIFDFVIKIPDDKTTIDSWRVENRARIYDLTPYDQTIVFDSDVIVLESTEKFWKLLDRKSTRLNSSHSQQSRMPSSA